MLSLMLLIGGIVVAAGIILSYIIGIRSLQESRRSINFRSREQNTARARRAFTFLGVSILAGIALLLFARPVRIELPAIPLFEIKSPTAEPPTSTETPRPLSTATQAVTAFALTATPVASETPTVTAEPAIPLVI